MYKPTNNLRNRPTATEYSNLQEERGTGQLNSMSAYLKNDPVSYFYQKFKTTNNEFLRDEFWSEAAQRGESDNLVALLQMTNDEKFDRKAYDALAGYGDRMDYDAYMLALQLPHLDNETKEDRIDEATGTNFGNFTEQEWATKVIDAMMSRWDAEIVEEDKANRGWLANVGTQIAAGTISVLGGAFQFLGDLYNLNEGLMNMLVDWSNESDKDLWANRGEKFLKAFADDDEVLNPYEFLGSWLNNASYEFQRNYATTVDAVAAYEQGYEIQEGNHFLAQVNNASNAGVGYSTWGRWMNGGTNAIGYMLPTVALGILTGGSSTAAVAAGKATTIGGKLLAAGSKVLHSYRSAIFYAGIFSGMVKDTVLTSQLNGISYKDLDAGKVLANAAGKAAVQYAIEVGLGMVLGYSGVDKLLGIGGRGAIRAGNEAARAVTGGTAKAMGRVLLGGAKAAGKEGLEEVLQELSDLTVDYAFGGTYKERAMDNFSIQNLTDAFIVGALTSVVMGSMSNVEVFIGNNRGIGIDASGQTFKMGAFQTLNLRQAMSAMNQWKETIDSSKASIEKKAAAMLSLNAAISTLGDVYRNMGAERATKADTLIMDMLNMQSKAEQIKALGNLTDYSNTLWDNFIKAQSEASAKYIKGEIETKIKKAIAKEHEKLKAHKVSEIDEVITTETDINNPNLTTSKAAQVKLKALLDKLGVEVIVGVDGNIVSKSDEVVFVNKEILYSGDVEAIVKGVAYDLALETVKVHLNDNQKQLIIKSYAQVTGLTGTLDDALMALLFDKSFYTHILLRMQERRYKNPAFEVLATIDQLIKNKLTPNIQAGTITERAYKILLEKVQKTMQTGLVTFATQHNKLDLGLIDNAVLPVELKMLISNHRNVQFTDMINEGLNVNTPVDFDRVEQFNNAIDKYSTVTTKEEIEEAKRKVKSENYNDRVDAYITLVFLAKNYDQTDKVVYLPAFATSDNVAVDIAAVKEVEAQFGVEWTKLLDGTYDVNDLTPEIQDFIVTNGYTMANRESRFAAIKAVLFSKSAKTLTLGSDGVILRVIQKNDFAKERYLGKDGQKNLHADIKSGAVKTLDDIAKIDLDPRLKGIKIVLDIELGKAGVNGGHVQGSDTIIVTGQDLLNVILHETTHVVQGFFATSQEYIAGGTSKTFDLLPNKVKDSLLAYIKEHFPLAYNLIKNPKNSDASIMYFMLAGELQANTTLSSLMFETGFRWKNNRTILVSPDGTTEWSMEPSKRKLNSTTKAATDIVEQAPVQEDKPLTPREVEALMQDPKKAEFVKGSMFTDQGVPTVFYRGVRGNANDALPSDGNGVFFSTKPWVSLLYTGTNKTARKGNTYRGYITNLKREDVITIEADGRSWDNLEYKDRISKPEAIIKDILDELTKQGKPWPKAILFENILEDWRELDSPETTPGDTLFLLDETAFMRVTEEDNGKFVDKAFAKGEPSEAEFEEIVEKSTKQDPKNPKIKFYNEAEGKYVKQSLKEILEYYEIMSDQYEGIDDFFEIHEIDEKYKKDFASANTELAPLPEGLSADEPLTHKALRELRDDPTIKRYIERGWLKRTDGTPMVFYRGWSPLHKNTEIHLAPDGNIPTGAKGGEFYSSDYTLSKEFGSRIEGFISNVTKEETKIYQLKNADWLDLHKHYTPEDLLLHQKIYEASRPFLTTIAVARLMSLGTDIESHILKRLGKSDLALWNKTVEQLMADHGVSRDTVVTVLSIGARWKDNTTFRTDELIPINLLQGYKAILMNDVNEVLGKGISTNLVLLRGTRAKKVTHSQKDINWDKVVKPETTRFISNKVAKLSNLKYFIRKGIPIQLDPRVAAFVSHTTENFDKLPKVIQTKILNGDLNRFDLIEFTATAKFMNDYTFQAIAKYVYNNDAMAQLTFNEVRALLEDISDLAALANVVDTPDLSRTPFELANILKVTNKKADRDPELGAKLIKARRNSQTVRIGNTYYESFTEPDQLLPIMMRHYNGSLTSLRHVNNFGKLMIAKQTAQSLIENADTEAVTATTTWNWIDKMRKADVDYEYDNDTAEALEDITRDDKISAIEEYITNELISRVNKMTAAQKIEKQAELLAELKKSISGLDKLSDEAINKRYLAVLANETAKSSERELEPIAKIDLAQQPRSTKNIKDHLRQAARTVTLRIAGLKRRYNSLPKSIQEALDPKTFKLKASYYSKMTDQQLETLLTNMKEAAKRLNASIKEAEIKAANAQRNKTRLATLAGKELKTEPPIKRTLKEKVDIVHRTNIVTQTFSFDSRENITKVVKELLNTQWGKRTLSRVQGLNNNIEQNVHNGKTFFEGNAETLLNMSTGDAEAAVKWFMDANIVGIAADSAEAQTFSAIKIYFLGYVLSQSRDGGQFHNFSANLRIRLENHLRTQTSVAGTSLAVWNNIQGLINPLEVMMNASMEIAGVILTDQEKENLLLAAVSNDMDAIVAARQLIIDRVNVEKTTKKTITRKITTLRSMSMLSNPVTWLRNRISNFMLLRLNKVATAIGNKIGTTRTAKGQFKMNGVITPEIQSFINSNFLDNKLFDTLVTNLSRYNPSDIQSRFKDATGKANKDAIFANMVIKSLYNEFYNQNLFETDRMNKLHGFLMKMLSDNNYVREASVRYFAKIIAERGYSLSQGVTDAIMNDFAVAIGMGMADYMHSDNFFNQIETVLAEKSEGALFVYKLILPFGSASWNWFKAAVRFSPIGLGQSIYKLTRLEQEIIKAETAWAKGKGQVSPELTEFLIRRDLGSGVIGTLSMLFGMMLAGLGYVELEEEDYGVPKLRIGNLRIDVSTIFGSSSVLAGMALVKGWETGDYMAGIDAMMDPMLDGFFLVQILEMDKYNNKGWASLGVNFMEQTLLSFIPNGLRWLSGATYTGKYKTNTFFERAVSRIPFFGSAFGLEKRVNPYTGDLGDAWDIFNRVVPFFEVRQTSFIEQETRNLGISKDELRGNYEINGEKFELSTSDVAALNRMYGQWNADGLTEFYSNKARYSVKMPNGSYRDLTYNQMTEDQRRNAIQNMFSKHAQYAKVSAWLAAGNIYYASATEYAALRKLGITGALYKGNKGFVKK